MTDRIERFKARQQLKAQMRRQPAIVGLPSGEEAEALRPTPTDSLLMDDAFSVLSLDNDVMVRNSDVDNAIQAFREAFNRERFDQLLKDSRRGILQAVAVPFGLGQYLAIYDKVGGNVDTIHNARNRIYATDEARLRYEANPKYESHNYHKDVRYVGKNRLDTDDQAKGVLKDAYTGRVLGPKQVDSRNLDHTISAKEIHEDAGRILAGVDGVALANAQSNLHSTRERFNKFKGQRPVTDVVAQLQQEAPKRLARISELESKFELSIKERNELELHRQKQAISDNPAHILKADQLAREKAENEINGRYYNSEKFRGDLVKTSIKEGGKMAFQQAFGLMLVEFFSATFDELQDFYRHGSLHKSWWPELHDRLNRVANRVSNQWRAALAAGAEGFSSGVLANLVTVLLNTLKTTGKRTIRMCREGFMSLLRSLKMLAFPPQGMSLREGAHEALKLVFAGSIVIGGVVLEEVIEKYIMAIPGLGTLGPIISAVMVGALTGIASTFVVYLVDRLDPLGVNRNRELDALHEHLDAELEDVRNRNDQWLLTLESSLDF